MAELAYVCAYFNWLEATEPLTDAEKGRLYTALLEYGMTGEAPELRGNERYVFHALKWTVDRDKKAYDEKCIKNRENGKKGDKRTVPNAPQEKEEEKEKEKYNLPTEEEEMHTHEGVRCSEIVALYHRICVSFPKVQSISSKRRKSINARLKTYSIEQFKAMFEKAESSSFLKGLNNRDWSATFDWLISDSNFAKVLDGNYDDKITKEAIEKPKKTRFVPNEQRDVGNAHEITMAIIDNELQRFGGMTI